MIRRSDNHTNQRIQVFARCRPLNSFENQQDSPSVVEVDSENNKLILKSRKTFREYSFDNVFSPDSNQIEVYKAVVEPLIHEVLLGYHCTLFAYGPTGTGKTYTMEGERSNAKCKWEDDTSGGIIPRSMHQLYELLNQMNVEFSVKASFFEIYNEDVYDLLASDFTKLRLGEAPNSKDLIKVKGLEEVLVNDKNEVYAILEKGTARRRTAETLLNAASSRSHTIFTITVDITENTLHDKKYVRSGKLNLVDLAGSENVRRSGAIDKQAREAGKINQSLLTLGRVMTSLIEKQAHIPYRESKLTRILQSSLEGKAKTSIIATVSPARCNYDETINTLEYAAKARTISIKPEINRKMLHRAKLTSLTDENVHLRMENATLQKDLEAARSRKGFFVDAEEHVNLVNKIALLEKEVACLRLENDKVQKVADFRADEVDQLYKKLQRQQNVAYANEDFCDKLRMLSQNKCSSFWDMITDSDKEIIQFFKLFQDDQKQMKDVLNDHKQEASTFNEEITNEVRSSLHGYSSYFKEQATNESKWNNDLLQDIKSMNEKCASLCEVYLKYKLPSMLKDFNAEMTSIDNWITNINKSLEETVNQYESAVKEQFKEKLELIGLVKELEQFFTQHAAIMRSHFDENCRTKFDNIRDFCDNLHSSMEHNGQSRNNAYQLTSSLPDTIELQQFLKKRGSKVPVISEVTSVLEKLQRFLIDQRVKANCTYPNSTVLENIQNNMHVANNLVVSLSLQIDEKTNNLFSNVNILEDALNHSSIAVTEFESRYFQDTSKLKEEISKGGLEIEKFFSEGFAKDVPTGATPQRRDYQSSRTFKETLPCHLLQQLQDYDESSSFMSFGDTSFASDIFHSQDFETESPIVPRISCNEKC